MLVKSRKDSTMTLNDYWRRHSQNVCAFPPCSTHTVLGWFGWKMVFRMMSLILLLPTPGIAWLCCDARRQVRMQALTYLQRALLVHDLQTLDAAEWESCFNKVRKESRSYIFVPNIKLSICLDRVRLTKCVCVYLFVCRCFSPYWLSCLTT